MEREIPPRGAIPHGLIAGGFALTAVIGLVDFVTGYDLSFSVFYVLPIALVTWFSGRRLGLAASILAAAVWLAADLASGHQYASTVIPVWNSLIRFTFFVIITGLLSALRKSTDKERELARTDSLTGATNSRFFYDIAQREIERFSRYGRPFTVSYIDLDNFKTVNDRFGHPVGDEVLRTIVRSARARLRSTDVIARLGGDEFALLLPETGEEAARAAMSKIRADLLGEMNSRGWPVTFSMGVLTILAPPASTEALVSLADELMYSVKRSTKDAIKYSTWTGDRLAGAARVG